MELGFVPLGAVTPGGSAVLQQVPCYSQALEDCIKRINSNQAPGDSQCAQWKALKEADLTAWNNAIDNMPYCPPVQANPDKPGFGMGFFTGAIIGGVLIAVALA